MHKLKDGQEEIIKFETTIVTFVSYPSHLLKNNATRIYLEECEDTEDSNSLFKLDILIFDIIIIKG